MTTVYHSYKCERISESLLNLADEFETRRRFTKSFRARASAALTKANDLLGEVDSELERLETKALEGYPVKKRKLDSDYTSSD